jgi:DNA-binding transcriptional ArsR family regulator
MTAEPDIAALALLVTEPARAAMLVHLLDGRSWTVTELARVAGIGAPTASAHLRRLLEGRLIQVSPSGRHRYFRIANAEVAQLVEQMARLAPARRREAPGTKRASQSLRRCRLCYDHLAGRLGIAIAGRMIERGWAIEAEPWYHLTDVGHRALAELGVAKVDGRTCMDWSERKLHIAGALGKQLAQILLAKDWLRRDLKSRALLITPNGAESLRKLFGLIIPD